MSFPTMNRHNNPNPLIKPEFCIEAIDVVGLKKCAVLILLSAVEKQMALCNKTYKVKFKNLACF